jgi:hypothetical protein
LEHPSSGIAEFFENAVLNAGVASPHRVLYHYTSVAGAIGIINSQKFWSTAHDCTNDEAELISANPVVTAVAQACRINAKGASRTVLDVFLGNYPTSTLAEIGIVYLACFSTQRDDPNQWREYGDRCSGVCLGIRILDEPGPKLVDRVSVMLEVDYSEPSLHKWLQSSFVNICAALAQARDIRHNHEEGLSALYRISAYASIKAKHDKWKNEREVRLATLVPTESDIVPRERTSATGKVIRYLPVSVRAGEKLIALDEIIIGSGQDADRARQEFETILASKGYTPGDVEYPRITVSSVSHARQS